MQLLARRCHQAAGSRLLAAAGWPTLSRLFSRARGSGQVPPLVWGKVGSALPIIVVGRVGFPHSIKMRTMLSFTLLSAVVSMLVGCETSNQSYSTSGRVIDATQTSVVRDTGLAGKGTVIDSTSTLGGSSSVGTTLSDSPVYSPVIDSSLNNSSTSAVGSDGLLDVGVLSGVGPSPDPMAMPSTTVDSSSVAGSGSLIGGVPDEPWMSGTPAPQGSVNTSASTGSVLLAQNNTAGAGSTATSSTRAMAPDSSSATIYQNKISTTAGPDRYKVVKGDTLYSIAFRYGLDYHALANINKIDPPYNLAVGQVLLLNLKAQEAPSYVVQKGDTLYSIARKNGQSVNFLASVNNLEPPYTLKLGQKLLLSRENAVTPATQKENAEVPVAGSTTASTTTAATKPSTSTATTKPATTKPATSTVAQTPIVQTKTRKVSGVTWSWPTTSGRVIEQFSTSEQGNKGLDISGQRGQAVLAAADGQVVYSGNALRGFGNLIIINHTNEYLSAYAHNDALLVKEGQKVKRGQQIARMGNTDASSVRLHFEIRYRGQSVNPISYLPK